jgi:flagellar transcriptional activator FlhC
MSVAAKKSIVNEGRQITIASELARMGARLQVLESETTLSRERLLRLYKEINGGSPPKGMLPFSTDWFLTWQPNTHASLFLGGYRHLKDHCKLERVEALVSAYRLYLEQCAAFRLEIKLSVTRAWILVRYVESGMLGTTPCTECGGHFVTHRDDLNEKYVCGLCNVPSRAGKTRAKADSHAASSAEADAPSHSA